MGKNMKKNHNVDKVSVKDRPVSGWNNVNKINKLT